MYNNKSIGIGIITYNRQFNYSQLLEKIKQNNDVDYIVSVKNKDIDYQNDDPKIICNDGNRTFNFHVKEDLGVGFCKNIALKKLMELKCDHYFLIEDDVRIKNDNVFKEYIDTAKAFNLEHLNFCRSFDTMITHDYVKPYFTILSNKNIQIFNRLSGDFSYFSNNALLKAGLFDERYLNALDHCEHTYRMSLLGFYTPFYAFADIENSHEFIEDTGTQTTILHDNKQQINTINAAKIFESTYGIKLNKIKKPTNYELLSFLQAKQIGVYK